MVQRDRLDNPAGRLLAWLNAFKETATSQVTILDVWSKVFEAKTADETLRQLASVANLLTEIEAALVRADDWDQLQTYNHFVGHWARPIFFPENHGRQTPWDPAALFEPGALVALGSVSAYLSATASEGPLPDDEAVEMMRGKVQELLDDLAADTALPLEIRRLLLDHLYRLAWALDHLRFGGPDAVRSATERLVGVAVVSQTTQAHPSVWERVVGVAGMIWNGFSKGPAVQSSVQSWGELLQLPPG